MAINIDHTQSANITLRGPETTPNNAVVNFVFPNTQLSEAKLLVSGDAPISSITGLTAALGTKANISDLGTVAYVNTGTVQGTVPVLDADGKLVSEIIPSFAIRDTFEVDYQSDITGLSNAQIGDIAIATLDKKNFVLTSSGVGAYSTSSNWKQIKFVEQAVTSVNGLCGDAVIDGSNVYLTDGYYDTQTLNYAISDLSSNKADLGCLNNYYTKEEITGCLSNYETISAFQSCLTNNYYTCSSLDTCLMDYATSASVGTCLLDYVPRSETGSSASRNVGTDAGDVVEVQFDGKISPDLVPNIAITDTFIVNTSGELTSLVGAEKGDIAIATGDLKNYILTGGSYATFGNWAALAATIGTVNSVNHQEPVNGDVTLTTDNINVANSNTPYDGDTVTNALSGINDALDQISGSYVTVQYATGLLANYVLTGVATGAFNTKSDNGHGHAISDVSGLSGCLSVIETFHTGAGLYSATQYGANASMNEALGEGSLAIGYGAKAYQDYEVAHAAGWFNNVGDAQASKIVSKYETIDDSLATVASVNVDSNTNLLFSAYLIGKAPSKYAAFKVEGAVGKDSTDASVSLLDDASCTLFVNTADAYAVTVEANTSNGQLEFKVSGDSTDSMKWVTSVNVVKVKNA